MGDITLSKVIIQECNEYDVDKIQTGLKQSLKQLGGLESFVKPGDNILLKINILTIKKVEQAATTHPAFIEAVAREFLDFGCNVYVADSPGGPFVKAMLKRVYKAAGITELENKVNVTLNYDTSKKVVFVEEAVRYKKMEICNYLDNMDHIISMSKMKTHGYMRLTGAVKNMFGVIPGITKAELHARFPELLDFADMLIDICDYIKPTLSFMDGIIAMEGEGPGSGTPKKMNTVLVSKNPHHLDYVAATLMKIEPTSIPTIHQGIERGYIKSDFSDIEFVGEYKQLIPKTYQQAKSNGFMSSTTGLLNFLKRYPRIINKNCIGCSVCADICPKETIEIVDQKAVIDYSNCISCFCCHEFCPVKAIDTKRRIWHYLKSRIK